jgi:hypothetical protein
MSFAQAQSPKLCTKHFLVEEATIENWNSGIVRNNSDTTGGRIFSVKINIKSKGYITFTNLIINNQQLPIEAIRNGARTFQGKVSYGDSLTLICRTEKKIDYPPGDKTIVDKVKARGDMGAIVYSLDDHKYFRPVKEFTQAKPVRRPQ